MSLLLFCIFPLLCLLSLISPWSVLSLLFLTFLFPTWFVFLSLLSSEFSLYQFLCSLTLIIFFALFALFSQCLFSPHSFLFFFPLYVYSLYNFCLFPASPFLVSSLSYLFWTFSASFLFNITSLPRRCPLSHFFSCLFSLVFFPLCLVCTCSLCDLSMTPFSPLTPTVFYFLFSPCLLSVTLTSLLIPCIFSLLCLFSAYLFFNAVLRLLSGPLFLFFCPLCLYSHLSFFLSLSF